VPAAVPVCTLFRGRIVSRVTCQNPSCRASSDTHDPFETLSLEIAGVDSVGAAMARFTAKEVLDGANRYRCGACKQLVRATKGMHVAAPPQVLAVHLKRFTFRGYVASKDPHPVRAGDKFELGQFMTLAPEQLRALAEAGYKLQPGETRVQVAYHLQSALFHVGHSAQSGHYFAFVKGARGGGHVEGRVALPESSNSWYNSSDRPQTVEASNRWFEMNDATVTPLTHEALENRLPYAYMLFYVADDSNLVRVLAESAPTVPAPAPAPVAVAAAPISSSTSAAAAGSAHSASSAARAGVDSSAAAASRMSGPQRPPPAAASAAGTVSADALMSLCAAAGVSDDSTPAVGGSAVGSGQHRSILAPAVAQSGGGGLVAGVSIIPRKGAAAATLVQSHQAGGGAAAGKPAGAGHASAQTTSSARGSDRARQMVAAAGASTSSVLPAPATAGAASQSSPARSAAAANGATPSANQSPADSNSMPPPPSRPPTARYQQRMEAEAAAFSAGSMVDAVRITGVKRSAAALDGAAGVAAGFGSVADDATIVALAAPRAPAVLVRTTLPARVSYDGEVEGKAITPPDSSASRVSMSVSSVLARLQVRPLAAAPAAPAPAVAQPAPPRLASAASAAALVQLGLAAAPTLPSPPTSFNSADSVRAPAPASQFAVSRDMVPGVKVVTGVVTATADMARMFAYDDDEEDEEEEKEEEKPSSDVAMKE
jgi:hypothetical protein